jgi:hypothetical protein
VLVVLLLLFFPLSSLQLFVSRLATLRVRRRLLLQLLLVVLVYRHNKPSTRLARAIDCLHTIFYSLLAPSNKDARSSISFSLISIIAASTARTLSLHIFILVVIVVGGGRMFLLLLLSQDEEVCRS